ncbi:MAG: hypothetical protein LBL45_07290 [Treponema sp.]|nr:hypothetical protein [Treponema sp.]
MSNNFSSRNRFTRKSRFRYIRSASPQTTVNIRRQYRAHIQEYRQTLTQVNGVDFTGQRETGRLSR